MKCFCAGITCQGDNFLYRFTRSTRFPSQLARSPFRSWICMSSDRRLFWSAFPDPVCRVQFSFALRSHAGYCNWPRFAANFSSWFWSRSRRAIFFFLLSRSAVKVSPKIFGSVCKSWCGSPSCCCLGLQDLIIIFLIQRQVLILILVCVTYPSSIVHEPGFSFHLYCSRSSFPRQRFAGLLILSSCLLPVALPAAVCSALFCCHRS
jgi:hypothetical protein